MALTKIDDRGLKTPIDLLDNEKIRLGTGNDLELYHNGTHTYLNNDTGTLVLQSDALSITNNAGNSNRISSHSSGEVKLYYSDSVKLETQTSGITVQGSVYALGTTPQLRLNSDTSDGSSTRAMFGMATSANNFVNGAAVNDVILNCPKDFIISHGSDELMAQFKDDSSVELYCDNTKRFETTSSGATVTGTAIATGLTINGATTPATINHTGGNALHLTRSSKTLAFNANYGASDTHATINVDSGMALRFQVNSNDKITFDSSGRVLIGTTTEGNGDGDDLTIATSGRTGITIRSADDDYGNIFFSDGTSGASEYVGKVQYYHSDNSMRFATNANDRLIINSSGDIGIGTTSPAERLHVYEASGAAVIRLEPGSGNGQAFNILSTYGSAANTGNFSIRNESGSSFLDLQHNEGTPRMQVRNGTANVHAQIDADGIKFNGDTAAANGLDDYEEGTFTPTVLDGNGSNYTIDVDTARYTKIGRQVTIDFQIKRTEDGSKTGILTMQSLPFTVAASTQSGTFWIDHGGPDTSLGDIVGGLCNISSASNGTVYFTKPTDKSGQGTASTRYLEHGQWNQNRWMYGQFIYHT